MSSPHHPYNRSSNSNFHEQRWIIQIRQALEEKDLDQESDIPLSIFNVPKTLIIISPQSYIPQQLALGPYHHCRPELYEMERCKLAAARRFQENLQGLKFHHLVDHLTKFEPYFRACYQKFLNLNGETLAWMMAVDSCFLLEFLQVFSLRDPGKVSRLPSRMPHLIGRKSGNFDAVIRDIVMLENQIPLLSLRKILEFQLGSSEESEKMIYETLTGFSREILPIRVVQELLDFHQVTKCDHLLGFLYNLIVPKSEGSSEIASEAEKESGEKINNFQKIISNIRLLFSKSVKFILSLPWKIVCNLPGVIMIKQIEYLCFSQEKRKNNDPELNKTCDINKLHPLMEEIAIPSVTELSRAGVRFSVTNSGILGIKFDEKMATFYLPRITLDVNSEVVLRNLVAYEACGESGPLIFTRYTELMNGIIDSDEDAKLLRENGIVLNHLKSDQDVANLWNGMSRSIRMTKVPFLDKVIEDVNIFYNGKWKVRIGKTMKRHVFGSWRAMALLAAILLLFLVSLQTFCSLFRHARLFVFHKKIN